MSDSVAGDDIGGSEGLFSPIKKSYLWIFFTSIYFTLLSIAYIFLESYLPNRIGYLEPFTSHFSISPMFLLLIIGVSISISIFAYRSFLKALMFFGVFFGLFLLLNLFFFMEVLIFIFVAFLITLVLGTLLRGFTRIKRIWVKVVLAFVPFLIILIITLIAALQGHMYTLEDCANLDSGPQWDCYMKFAIENNNISICSGHSFDGGCIEKVIANSNGDYHYNGECDNFERKDVCYLAVVRATGNFSLCDKMSTPSLEYDTCKHPIM